MRPTAPEAIRLRRFCADDIPFAHELRALAGWNQTEKDWHGYLRFEPEGCLIAEIDGARVGTATTIRYGNKFGWIGMVLVHPDRRRLGVGSKLLMGAIDYLQRSGVRSVRLDATPMGRQVYLPLGFVDEYRLSRWEGVAPPMDGVVTKGVAELQAADLPEIAGFDEVIFGANRVAVLAELTQRNPGLCFVSRTAGGIAGFLVAREGARAVQVGPWLARDAVTAEQLFDALLRRIAGRLVFVDVPAPNSAGDDLCRRHGFHVQRSLTRMYLGGRPEPGRPELVYSINGAEKG